MAEDLTAELRRSLGQTSQSARNIEIVMKCNGWDLGPRISETKLAKEYGISPSRVQQIRNRAERAIIGAFEGKDPLRFALQRVRGKPAKWVDPATGMSTKNIRRLGYIFRIPVASGPQRPR